MIAKELINTTIPFLNLTDSGSQALKIMNEFKVTHLPLVQDKIYIGLVSEKAILDMENPDESIEKSELQYRKPAIEMDQHIYDIIRIVAGENISLIPVVNEQMIYLGVIPTTSLINYLSKIMALDNPGGIIILELNIHDYHLSEIAHIVESNNAQIVHLFVVSNMDSTKLEVNLKLNIFEIEPILQAFRRYNYTIQGAYFEKSDYQDLQSRYAALINYLNI